MDNLFLNTLKIPAQFLARGPQRADPATAGYHASSLPDGLEKDYP